MQSENTLPVLEARKIEKLRRKIGWLQRRIETIRKILGILTLIERLQWQAKVYEIASNYNIDADALVATIWCESGMNPKVIGINRDGTKDYGICQFNSYWYRNKISPWDAVNHPEKAIKLMCEEWEKGRAQNWVCYSTGKYKKFYDKILLKI